ncbi:MAG: hypothetical protein IT388_11925 [Nitrospirales bacterium]|nr:hypothetical protein [Nitrospirales bacterium]
MLLNKDQILGAQDLTHEDVHVPEWGGTVRIRMMTGSERDAFEAAVYETKGKDVTVNRENFRAQLLARVLVDEEGKRLFSDAEIKALGSKSAAALNRLFPVAQKLNGLAADDVEELTKN